MANILFEAWIRDNVQGDSYGKCRETTLEMASAFPALTRVRGHYWCPVRNERLEHWWLVTRNGTVVDPTAMQFLSAGTGRYEPWTEGAEEPVGTCLTCGAYRYAGRDDPFCSEACLQNWLEDPV
jgi:hypothetical protein